MENLPLELEPRTWGDYVHQRHAVRYLCHFIRTGSHPNALLIEGPTGVGKSTLAKLYVQATHCERRQPHEVDPCGECTSCKRNLQTAPVTSDVLWLQKGGDSTIEAQVKQALELRQQPTYRGEAPHRDFRFVVADEIQSYGSSVLEQLLQVEWSCVAPTVFVMITMDGRRIDPVLYQALRDRCFVLTLLPIPEREIQRYLMRHWPLMTEQAAAVVARAAGGSIRHALSYMRLLQMEAADPVTGRGLTAAHACLVLNLATTEVRQRLWDALQNPSYTLRDLKQVYDGVLEYVLEDRLVRQLLEDLNAQGLCRGRLTEVQLWARYLLLQVLADPWLTLWDVLVGLKNQELVDVQALSDDDTRGRLV